MTVSMRFGMCLLLAVASGCVDRNLVDDAGPVPEDEEDPDALGERPDDGMYAACSNSAQCAPLEFCVFPTDEMGYCTERCVSADDPTGCKPAPGDGAMVSCLDIALPGDDRVCALDCAAGACPNGMRCEGIETIDGEQRVCF
jgi:hypothetical protein